MAKPDLIMKNLRNYSVILLLLFNVQHLMAQQTVTLKGEVVGRKSSKLIIIPRTTSIRAEDKPSIKIVNEKFEYTFTAPHIEGYELVFEDELEQGAWRPVIIFPDTNVIELKLFSQEKSDSNVIKGGAINRSYAQYLKLERERYGQKRAEISQLSGALFDSGKYFSEAYYRLIDTIKTKQTSAEKLPFYQKRAELEKIGQNLSPAGRLIHNRSDSLQMELYKWRYYYFKENPSLANYFVMYNDVQYSAKDNQRLAILLDDAYKTYAQKYPNHLYTKVVGDAIAGIIKIFPGNPFIDFTAPDLNGKEVSLSSQINGKVALINLWGSWCGPCIAKAQQLVPIYKKYKDKGFTVVGVAREFKNTKALLSRLKQEEFNWLNLVEMDDKQGIWNKYSISNGAGIQVLVDANGIILAVDPTAEEVDQIVKKLMKG